MIGRVLLLVGAVNGALVVGLGAYGAHALSDATAGRFHTALLYHMFHTLGVIALGIVASGRARARLLAAAGAAGALMLLGILLFCGSLYAAAIGGYGGLIRFTPFGGAAFIAAWVLFAAGVVRR